MDFAMEIKQEDCSSNDLVSQNEREVFHKVIAVKSYSNAVLPDDNDCDMAIKTEIRSETYFPEFEAVTCKNNFETVTKIKIEEEDSDFGTQKRTEFLSQDPLMKLKDFNSDHEMDNKIEIKAEHLWLERETSVCGDIKDEDFPRVTSSRLCTDGVSSVVSDKSSWIAAEVSGRDANFYPRKDNAEYERQKSDVTEMPSAQEHVLSEQSGKCSEGEEMYITPLQLKQKPLVHKTKRPHTCKTCEKSFTRLSHLKSHYFIHDGKKSHLCETCGKRFTHLLNLKRHYLVHEGKKPHQCKICYKSYTWLSNLKTHNLIHEGKKPHKCETCDKRFTRSSDLNQHNLIHEGKKPYQCKTCNKSFTQLSNLKTHNLIHEANKPHKCKTCGKCFTRSSDLNKHNFIHEGKKPYQCSTCDKSFTRLSNLKAHNLIHEGKKPHQCKTCDKSFTSLSNLKRHYLIHESKK